VFEQSDADHTDIGADVQNSPALPQVSFSKEKTHNALNHSSFVTALDVKVFADQPVFTVEGEQTIKGIDGNVAARPQVGEPPP
jgi:hypothetical protein